MVKIDIQSFPEHFTPHKAIGAGKVVYVPYSSRLLTFVDDAGKRHVVNNLLVVTDKRSTQIELYCDCCENPIVTQKQNKMSFKVEVYVNIKDLVLVPRLLG